MRVLITGGAGFIGSHLVEYHLNNNDVVHVLDDLSTGTEQNIVSFRNNPNFQFTKANILTSPDLEKGVCWADRIYHMAAVVGVFQVIKESEKLLATNIIGTERLLRFTKLSDRNPRVLLASTSEVYGDGTASPSKEDANLIIGEGKKSCSAYAVSKIAGEYFGLSYYEHFKLPVTILRIFNTIGPRQLGQYGMVVPRFVHAAIQQEPILVYGTGLQTRSFCDVRDMVMMMDKIANTPETSGKIFNVGQDQEISINDLATLVKKLANSPSDIKHISYEEAYGEGFSDFMYRRPSLAKLNTFIAYQHQWDLTATISDLIAKLT